MCIENTCPSNIQSPVATAALIFWLIGHQGEKEKHVTEMEWGGAALQKQTETVRQEETETVRQQETEIVRQQETEKECA